MNLKPGWTSRLGNSLIKGEEHSPSGLKKNRRWRRNALGALLIHYAGISVLELEVNKLEVVDESATMDSEELVANRWASLVRTAPVSDRESRH